MILIPDAVFDDDHAQERDAAAPTTLIVRRAGRPDDISEEEWREADAVLAYFRLNYDATLCARLAKCRILVRVGVGYDNIDLAAFAARGIPVCNVPDYGVGEVADHTMALLLSLTRGIVAYHAGIAADPRGGWDWRRWPAPVQRLQGKRLLIVGYGTIGQAVGQRAAAFGLEVSHVSSRTSEADLDAALAEADIVSLHAALAPATEHLIDRRRIFLMKRGAILINTARGRLVDLGALAAALESGHLGAAGLDVLEDEPPDPTHPLFAALRADAPWLSGRLIVTPHAAFLSAAAIEDMRRSAVETALLYLRDGTLRHCVNGMAIHRPGASPA